MRSCVGCARRAWGGGPRGHGGGPVLGHEGAFAAQDFFAFQAAPATVGLTAAAVVTTRDAVALFERSVVV